MTNASSIHANLRTNLRPFVVSVADDRPSYQRTAVLQIYTLPLARVYELSRSRARIAPSHKTLTITWQERSERMGRQRTLLASREMLYELVSDAQPIGEAKRRGKLPL